MVHALLRTVVVLGMIGSVCAPLSLALLYSEGVPITEGRPKLNFLKQKDETRATSVGKVLSDSGRFPAQSNAKNERKPEMKFIDDYILTVGPDICIAQNFPSPRPASDLQVVLSARSNRPEWAMVILNWDLHGFDESGDRVRAEFISQGRVITESQETDILTNGESEPVDVPVRYAVDIVRFATRVDLYFSDGQFASYRLTPSPSAAHALEACGRTIGRLGS